MPRRAYSQTLGRLLFAVVTGRDTHAEPALKEKVLAKNMLKRLGEPKDVAWCATWLASDEARYVTGADFAVDAGATAW